MHSIAAIACRRQFLNWTKHWKVVLGWMQIYLNSWVNRLMPLLHSGSNHNRWYKKNPFPFEARRRVHKLMMKVVQIMTAGRNVSLIKWQCCLLSVMLPWPVNQKSINFLTCYTTKAGLFQFETITFKTTAAYQNLSPITAKPFPT